MTSGRWNLPIRTEGQPAPFPGRGLKRRFNCLPVSERDVDLAIFAVQQVAHRLPASLVHFTRGLTLVSVLAVLRCRDSWFGGAARRAMVGETRFIRLQLELFCAESTDFYWESHLPFMIRRL